MYCCETPYDDNGEIDWYGTWKAPDSVHILLHFGQQEKIQVGSGHGSTSSNNAVEAEQDDEGERSRRSSSRKRRRRKRR